MTQKNAIYKVDNGSTFDEIMFKTIASQVSLNDGRNLETLLQGIQTEVTGSGNDEICIRLPGGGIIQGTFHTILPVDVESNAKKLWFPKAFPNKCLTAVIANRWVAGSSGNGYDMVITDINNDGIWINPCGNTWRKVEWIAIGY